MDKSIRNKLSVMMFLEYVIWGAWLPLLGLYLGKDFLNFTGMQQAWIFNAFAIASIVGMFLGGQFADRYFAQQKFLAFSHVIGAITMFALPHVRDFWPFFSLMLIHCLFYVPTLSMANAIAFTHLKDAQRDFGFVRVWGTIGWIAAAWPFVFIPIDWAAMPSVSETGSVVAWFGKALGTLKTGPALEAALASTFTVGGIASVLLAVFSFFLPNTAPIKDKGQRFAPFEAIKLLATPSIAILFFITFFDALVQYCYFFWTSRFLPAIGLAENWIAPVMSIGQITEILAMAGLGFVLKRLGWRKTMLFGILAQGLRFLIYSIGSKDLLWLVILSNAMHGFAYAFFFASVYIFVDEHFPKDARTSAQSLFNLQIYGLGPFLGFFLWGWLGEVFKQGDGINYNHLFLVPMVIGFFAAAVLLMFFHPAKKSEGVDQEAVGPTTSSSPSTKTTTTE